ncbi:MAG: peptide ABC transporter permease [Rhodospirillaceae bacterium]|nr:peptide ABC transporter permease [Rhodospirillaceae bacterium]
MNVGSIIHLSILSLLNRRLAVLLSICAIAVSVSLIFTVEKLRQDAKRSFADTISDTDLIVGARSGSVQLLLYSVFRIGNATNNISWRSYRSISDRDDVLWSIPISLGDSHRGFRVMGTTRDYFEYYRFGRGKMLELDGGKPFDDVFDAVLGAEVAADLGYKLDQRMIIAHGIGKGGFTKHDDKPFRVAGILKRTGTPVDRTVHISLAGITAIHVDWKAGAPIPGMSISADAVRKMDLTPRSITAFLLGLKSRLGAFKALREINNFSKEPLLAVLPGVALQELWDLMSTAETALRAISIVVVFGGLLGMLTMLLTNLNERRREMAILRAVGARPHHVAGLFVTEAILITIAGIVGGLCLFYAGLFLFQPVIEDIYGLFISVTAPTVNDLMILLYLLAGSVVAGLIPAVMAYRQSLSDGIIVRN